MLAGRVGCWTMGSNNEGIPMSFVAVHPYSCWHPRIHAGRCCKYYSQHLILPVSWCPLRQMPMEPCMRCTHCSNPT